MIHTLLSSSIIETIWPVGVLHILWPQYHHWWILQQQYVAVVERPQNKRSSKKYWTSSTTTTTSRPLSATPRGSIIESLTHENCALHQQSAALHVHTAACWMHSCGNVSFSLFNSRRWTMDSEEYRRRLYSRIKYWATSVRRLCMTRCQHQPEMAGRGTMRWKCADGTAAVTFLLNWAQLNWIEFGESMANRILTRRVNMRDESRDSASLHLASSWFPYCDEMTTRCCNCVVGCNINIDSTAPTNNPLKPHSALRTAITSRWTDGHPLLKYDSVGQRQSVCLIPLYLHIGLFCRFDDDDSDDDISFLQHVSFNNK